MTLTNINYRNKSVNVFFTSTDVALNNLIALRVFIDEYLSYQINKNINKAMHKVAFENYNQQNPERQLSNLDFESPLVYYIYGGEIFPYDDVNAEPIILLKEFHSRHEALVKAKANNRLFYENLYCLINNVYVYIMGASEVNNPEKPLSSYDRALLTMLIMSNLLETELGEFLLKYNIGFKHKTHKELLDIRSCASLIYHVDKILNNNSELLSKIIKDIRMRNLLIQE